MSGDLTNADLITLETALRFDYFFNIQSELIFRCHIFSFFSTHGMAIRDRMGALVAKINPRLHHPFPMAKNYHSPQLQIISLYAFVSSLGTQKPLNHAHFQIQAV